MHTVENKFKIPTLRSQKLALCDEVTILSEWKEILAGWKLSSSDSSDPMKFTDLSPFF